MKNISIIAYVLFISGCTDSVVKKDLHLLNGYWEIAKVTFPDGNHKEYKANTSIDYISVTDNEGFRKKVQPKLDGTFDTSDDAVAFSILETENGLAFSYKNELSEWMEELIELSHTHFSTKNEEGLIYKYQRFEPININK